MTFTYEELLILRDLIGKADDRGHAHSPKVFGRLCEKVSSMMAQTYPEHVEDEKRRKRHAHAGVRA